MKIILISTIIIIIIITIRIIRKKKNIYIYNNNNKTSTCTICLYLRIMKSKVRDAVKQSSQEMVVGDGGSGKQGERDWIETG